MTINFSTTKGSTLKSTGSKGSVSGTTGFTLISAKISIANLTIEENSGNDVEQQGDHNDGDGDNENNDKEGANTENDDVRLPGPYVLNVINGMVIIDKVDVYPGTFKKVDFIFLINNEADFGGNSIIVKGNYQKTDGTVLPVVLKSDFNQQVQVPLANGGITVAANSTVELSIVLDIPTWINNIDLSSADVTNNEILIDKTNNQELLKLFEENLISDIEVED